MALLERFYDPSSGVVQAVWLQNRWEVDFGEVSTGVVDLHGLKNVAWNEDILYVCPEYEEMWILAMIFQHFHVDFSR